MTDFEHLRLMKIARVIYFMSHRRGWTAANRDTHIMGITISGHAVHRFPGRNLTLGERTVFFFNRRENYEVINDIPGDSLSVHFTTADEISTESFCFTATDGTPFLNLLKQMQSACENPRESLTAAAKFYSLCSEIQKYRNRPYAPGGERIKAAQDYLNLHYKEKNCLDKAAEICGISRRRFNDLFARACRVTPNRWITLKKIEYAKSLMTVDGISLGSIAEDCGFGDVYYFSRVFKSETGLSPSCYRKELKRDGNMP